jgi:uncharacterized protein
MFKKLLLVLLLMFPTIQARELPKNPNCDYVYDETGIVTEETKTFVDELNEQLASTGAEVVVAVIPTLDGQDIESFANELFRDWGIGDKIKNNGILLLVAIDDRLMRIEVGYGLEGAIPDSVAGRIIRTYLQPNFKEEKYNEGIQEAVQAICEYIAIEYNISLNGKTPEELKEQQLDEQYNQYLSTLVMIIIVIVFLIIIFSDDDDGYYYYGGGGSSYRGSSSSSGWSSGGGSSFGGGSSGGGGASGSW